MIYKSVCIAVRDINLARKFYEDLFGLEVFQDYGKCVMFEGGLSLQQDFDWLVGIEKDLIVSKPHNMELYFEEDDFDGFLERLREKDIQYLHEVKEAPWGQRMVRIFDLDGHIIEIAENAKLVIKRFMDSGLTLEQTAKRMDIAITEIEKLLK